jgi:hypothetical protein
MIKKKNADIASLRKQLKLPPTEDSQAKEIAEAENEKEELLKLIMQQNAQLREMEAELEKLLKEKEQSTPMEVIPLSAVPISRSQYNNYANNHYNRNSISNSIDNIGKDCGASKVHGGNESAGNRDQ